MAISMHLEKAYQTTYDATGDHEAAADAAQWQYVKALIYDAGLTDLLCGPQAYPRSQVLDADACAALRARIEQAAKRKPSLQPRAASVLALLDAAIATGDTVFLSY